MSKLKAVMNRDYTLRSLTGHTIIFKRGVPQGIPAMVKEELINVGADISGNEVEIAKAKTQNAVHAKLEAEAANAKAEAATAQQELAELKRVEADEAETKRTQSLEKAKLVQQEKARLKREAAAKEAKKELDAEK